jgi:hypothetical protein
MRRVDAPVPAGPLELIALQALDGPGHVFRATLADGASTRAVVVEAADLADAGRFAEVVATALGRVYRPLARGEADRWLDTVLALLDAADAQPRRAR